MGELTILSAGERVAGDICMAGETMDSGVTICVIGVMWVRDVITGCAALPIVGPALLVVIP